MIGLIIQDLHMRQQHQLLRDDGVLQTSLEQFTEIYTTAIDSSDQSHITARRIANLVTSITTSAWSMTMCGLFERHKPVFTLLLAQRVASENGKVNL